MSPLPHTLRSKCIPAWFSGDLWNHHRALSGSLKFYDSPLRGGSSVCACLSTSVCNATVLLWNLVLPVSAELSELHQHCTHSSWAGLFFYSPHTLVPFRRKSHLKRHEGAWVGIVLILIGHPPPAGTHFAHINNNNSNSPLPVKREEAEDYVMRRDWDRDSLGEREGGLREWKSVGMLS